MKWTLSFLLMLSFSLRSAAGVTLSEYLKASFWLGYYQQHPSEIPSDLSNYKNLISVNLGYDNAEKYELLLHHFLQKNDTGNFFKYCDQSLADGVYAKSIEKMAMAYPVYYGKYRNAKSKAVKAVEFALWRQLEKMHIDDQFFRTNDVNTRENYIKMDSVDEYDYSVLYPLTKKEGWLWCYRFDTITNYDSIRTHYDLFPLVSHFIRPQIENFRDLAITYASQNKISWGEVIAINQTLYWKHSLYYTKETKDIFPLSSVQVNKSGQLDFSKSFLELYSLGHVVMSGLKNMRITLYPTEKMIKEFPETYQSKLEAYKRYLVVFGASAANIEIGTKPMYVLPPLTPYYMYYRMAETPAGMLRLPSPYNMVVWKG